MYIPDNFNDLLNYLTGNVIVVFGPFEWHWLHFSPNDVLD